MVLWATTYRDAFQIFNMHNIHNIFTLFSALYKMFVHMSPEAIFGGY